MAKANEFKVFDMVMSDDGVKCLVVKGQMGHRYVKLSDKGWEDDHFKYLTPAKGEIVPWGHELSNPKVVGHLAI